MKESQCRRCLVITLAMVCSAIGAACGSSQPRRLVEAGVKTFHDRLDSEDYESIYADADNVFRRDAGPKDGVIRTMGLFHDRLGRTIEPREARYVLSVTPQNGTIVEIAFETEFGNGGATEQFVWHITGGKALLVHYHVGSPLLPEKD